MALDEEQLKKTLIESDLLNEDQVGQASAIAREHDWPLSEALIREDYISDEHLGQIIADLLGFPFVYLTRTNIDESIFKLIPEIVARNQLVIAYQRENEKVKIAMADPDNIEIQQLIQKRIGEKLQISYATPEDIRNTLHHYRKGLKEEFSTLLEKHVSEAAGAKAEDVPIIKIVDILIEYAYENHASDIHIEPHDEKVIVRYRIDGILHDAASLPKDLEESVIARLKIMASLRTDEHRAAQDGRLQKKFDNEKVDIRISVVPISEGEKVVMRLLSQRTRRFNLEDLGFSQHDLKIIKKSLKRPHGMILATGPTGSGKTTTLYAVLKVLNTRKVNISTIEDPVEYDIEGINQIQVSKTSDLTFANGLRSILRQDPDIIMVGEIRDEETADIAINAAMTGHIVLSTLHTNDATTTLPRLIDMGIEPFLIASTINVAIGQRLVRKVHQACIESYSLTQEEKDKLIEVLGEEKIRKTGLDKKNIRLYRGTGCNLCHGSGYESRIGIFEVLEITEEIRKLIMKRSNSEELRQIAISAGMTTMLEDGIQKVLQGTTTLEEVFRVTKE